LAASSARGLQLLVAIPRILSVGSKGTVLRQLGAHRRGRDDAQAFMMSVIIIITPIRISSAKRVTIENVRARIRLSSKPLSSGSESERKSGESQGRHESPPLASPSISL